MRILQVADRPGWAIDRLSKPLSEMCEDTDMSYFSVSPQRYLDSGYSDWKGATHYTTELGNKYDIVHFHRVDAAVSTGLDNLKAQKVITIHTERTKDYDDERILLFDKIICPTRFAYDYCLLKYPNHKLKFYHVPHGIDLNKYKVSGKPQGKEVGYVGRIVEWKRWPLIQKSVKSAGLKLIGCGYIDQGQIFSENNYKQGEDFEYYIFLPEPQMVNFYNRMNLFVCMSKPHIEAGPLPIMEAMACGVPVISTRVGWAKDYCEHGKNIYFVDEEEVPGLVNILKKVFGDRILRENLRNNALKLIKDFSLQKYGERIREVYKM